MATEGSGSARAPAGVTTRAPTKPSTIPVAPARCCSSLAHHGCARSDGATGRTETRRPAHSRGARREDARADSNSGFIPCDVRREREAPRERGGAGDALLTQLGSGGVRDELDDDEYEETRVDTLTQLEEFKASLARMAVATSRS